MTLARIRPPLFALCLGTALCSSGVAHAAATGWVGDNHAAVRLITSVDHVAGATLNAGLEFRFADGWHGYWRTPGDAGVAPQINWSRSDNVAGADVTWPAPHRLVIEGLQNAVYEGDVVVPIKFRIKSATAAAGIEVGVSYAACSDVCVPYQAKLTLPLSPGLGKPAAEAPLIEHAKAQVPGSPQSVQIDVVRAVVGGKGSERKLTVELRSAKPFVRPDLFVEGAGAGIPAAPEVGLGDDGRSARLFEALPASLPTDHPLTLTVVDQDRSAEFSTTANSAGAAPAGLGTLTALVSALLGGLILNLMPCVLPVLSIKLLAFTRHASEGLRVIRLGALATAAGITFSFLLIAISLVILKWSGATLGWGIQFQQPLFLAGMATVTVLFAASFFELLPIALPSSMLRFAPGRTYQTLEAFLAGAFATLLATPCSAPFVGTAVGFALTRGPLDILAIFLCLGIGMSLPYLTAAVFPGSVRWLPRPGRWMILLRQVLGVLLLGTAVWLLFILWSTAGALVAATTGILLAALFGFRALLRFREGTILSRGSRAATAILAVAPLFVSISAASPTFQTSAEPRWQSFDPVALQRLVGGGKTVLVDVTATWCLICKVNELAVFDNDKVRWRLGEPDVVRMRADWTRPDPAITMYLHHFSRFGIPLDVVYGPRQPQGNPLPELLTPGILIQALDHAAASTGAELNSH